MFSKYSRLYLEMFSKYTAFRNYFKIQDSNSPLTQCDHDCCSIMKHSTQNLLWPYRITIINKSRKSLWINLGDGEVRFSGGKGPQKKLEKRKSE